MKKYIDADKLKEDIKDLPTWWADDGGVYGHSMKYPEGMFDCEDIINSIDNQPRSDVEEVVRCENCRAFDEYKPPVEDFDGRCVLDGIERDKDFYCAYGRRK